MTEGLVGILFCLRYAVISKEKIPGDDRIRIRWIFFNEEAIRKISIA